MNDGRRREGRETWNRLREWEKSQPPAERLAGHILRLEGFTSLDPSHPLGGKDGLKDIVATFEGKKWIAAAYFPRGQQSMSTIKSKFLDDYPGVAANIAEGFVFVTNQELKLGERRELIGSVGSDHILIYHLERLASILDSPIAYGIRLDFLDIEMTKEDQLSLFAYLDERNATRLEEAFQLERRLVAEDRTSRSKATIANHAVTFLPAVEEYRFIAAVITTPRDHPHWKPAPSYRPDFELRDLRDLHKSTFALKYPLFESAIERYGKAFRRLLDELTALIRSTDHSQWPELPGLCQQALLIAWNLDFVDHLIEKPKMRVGDQLATEADAAMLSGADNDLTFQGSNMLDAYRALALQIKQLMPLLDQIERVVHGIASNDAQS